MFRIIRVFRNTLSVDNDRVRQVQEIFRKNFSAVADYADKIPDMLDNPLKYGYTSMLLVSETMRGRVSGFSLILYYPKIKSGLLDFMAVDPDIHGGGIGGALYEATREYLKQKKALGLYMEALTDDEQMVTDKEMLKENRRRLRFYEGYGAYPIIETEYETPVDDSPPPYLLYDNLDSGKPLKRSHCRAAIRTILTSKYSHLVEADYIEHVVESVVDDPVRLREPKYRKAKGKAAAANGRAHLERPFVMVSSEVHKIHHVSERGYVERPARVSVIKKALEAKNIFEQVKVRHYSQDHILAVHSSGFVNYLSDLCGKLGGGSPVYPYVFPIRNAARPPKDLAVRAGYYCIDTFTPLDKNAYQAARAAVDVALTAAACVLDGKAAAYAICRPPGHHAEKNAFGGFCYFNNAAIAADFLSKKGKVAVLDIDFHHCNGTQNIFYERNDVITVSIHGHPNIAYPYFSGFADEKGAGEGTGFNMNLPLGENCGDEKYLKTLDKALVAIGRFAPRFLVLSLGFDIMKGDPTGSFDLSSASMGKIGEKICGLKLPVLVVQEGGYSLRNLKTGSAAFFTAVARETANAYDL
jgi:acetoin utilization deacetylase AcuC-like enzyme/GNAT superfamily N-acetyltransferase